MRITINGQKKEMSSSQSLREVIGQFRASPAVLIAEINGTIIKKDQWDQIRVNDGDTVELVSFVGGG
ncbi:MAG: sulfur carrier protein ThiS [Candidatus Omnitrophica bacterium]|nr:sulfur carrier protein ThiS [Candidatus Omnitrophota bacterium]